MSETTEKEGQLQELIAIVETLRSENGCPWDRVQTHTSLKPCVVEEAAELTAAIRIYDQTGSYENLREELGDLMLQVVMHSQIAKEEGLFSIEDVIHEVSQKMIRRHPHVFGDTEAKTTGAIQANWEEIKAKEKEGKDWIASPLREIPPEFPALTRAVKTVKKIDKLYEKQPDTQTVSESIEQRATQLSEAVKLQNKEEIENCLGDLLVLLSKMSFWNKMSAEQILTDRVDDMIEQYEPTNIIKS